MPRILAKTTARRRVKRAPLEEYIRKRDFSKTAEPTGKIASTPSYGRFVIQKHAASRLHYDFRLEIAGTLKSWAVPKGLPYTKGEKRLAVQVEDHPVSYINFEGIIPQGQYGGGTVMVWDQGTFETVSASPTDELAAGKLHFVLHGKKLEGEWYLVRLRDEKQWLLIKGKEDMRPVSARMDDTSAASGKTMKQLGAGGEVWNSNRAQPKPRPVRRKRTLQASAPLAFVEPMKARLTARPPAGDWLYEIKFDGFRALALKNGGDIGLWSRNEKDFKGKFPEVARSVADLKVGSAIIDGEIVALDPQGRSSFQLLQAYDLGEKRPPIYFYAFDLLQLEGNDLKNKPLTFRKAELAKVLDPAPGVIRFSPSLEGEVANLLKRVRKLGLEGLIGKRSDSKYEPGRRSGNWIKLKLNQEQEMVIGGYSNPEGSRKHFGALLVGYYEKHELRFAGKVGTGFNEALLRNLSARFAEISQPECPFVNVPENKAGRHGAGLTLREMRNCHWIAPKLVCQVKFSEWTEDGKLRQPVFLGLRDDKLASEVARERPH